VFSNWFSPIFHQPKCSQPAGFAADGRGLPTVRHCGLQCPSVLPMAEFKSLIPNSPNSFLFASRSCVFASWPRIWWPRMFCTNWPTVAPSSNTWHWIFPRQCNCMTSTISSHFPAD
jgi:hypothetical protein